MEDIISKFINRKLREEVCVAKNCVGEVPSHLNVQLRNLKIEHENLEEEMEIRRNQYALEAKKKMFEEFDTKLSQFSERHKKVWDEIYRTLGIDPHGSYLHQNGKIYQHPHSDTSGSLNRKNDINFTKPFPY